MRFDDDEMSEVSSMYDERHVGDPPPPGGFLSRLGRTATELITKQYFRTAINVQHKTLEDFGRIERGAGAPGRRAPRRGRRPLPRGGQRARVARARIPDSIVVLRVRAGPSSGGSW